MLAQCTFKLVDCLGSYLTHTHTNMLTVVKNINVICTWVFTSLGTVCRCKHGARWTCWQLRNRYTHRYRHI